MAILVRPELVRAPYRAIAGHADVALGTVAGCMNDLAARGLTVDGTDGRRIAKSSGTRRPVGFRRMWRDCARSSGSDASSFAQAGRRRSGRDSRRSFQRTRTPGPSPALTPPSGARTSFARRKQEREIYAALRIVDDRDTQRALVAQPAARGGSLLVIDPPGPLAIPAATDDSVPMAPLLLAYAELRYRATRRQALEAAELLLPQVLDHAAH